MRTAKSDFCTREEVDFAKSIRKTKNALLTSVISMVLCFAMLMGSTFAWFTDTASTAVNTIQAGKLDLVVEVATEFDQAGNPTAWEEVNENTKLFKNLNGEDILWEPGAGAQEMFRIRNNGNLALKYKFEANYTGATKTKDGKTLADILKVQGVAINIENGELNDRLVYSDVTGAAENDGFAPLKDMEFEEYLLPGEARTLFTAIVWQPTDHDNDFNVVGGLSIKLGISVSATQYTYEYDSEDNQYDKDAQYTITTSSAAGSVYGISYNGANVEKVLESTQISHSFSGGINDGIGVYLRNGAKLTMNNTKFNAVVENDTGKRNTGIFCYNGTELTINSGDYSIEGNYGILIWGQGNSTAARNKITINGGNFKFKGNSYGGILHAYSRTDAYITGGFFDASEGDSDYTLQCRADCTITVTGGTFVKYDPRGKVIIPSGYKVLELPQADGTNWYQVVAE